MLLGNQGFLKSLSVSAVLGVLSFSSTLVLSQDTSLTPSENSGSELVPYTPPEPVMETSYDLLLLRGNVLSSLTPDQSAEEVTTPLVKASAEEAKDIPGFQHLVATLPLRKETPQKVMFARSEELGTFDTLIVDRNLDGSFMNEAPIIISREALAEDETQTTSRDGQRMIEFQTALMSDHVYLDLLPDLGDYPAILRLKWTDLRTTPKELIWFGYYFYQTEINVANKTYQILLHDINSDGHITDSDHWILKDKSQDLPDNSSRKISDFNWVNGSAWKIDLKRTKGNRGHIYRINPKLSYEEDLNNRDPWSDDKNSERAEKEHRVSILTDHDKLLKKSSAEQKLSILQFEGTWCETCSAINFFVLPQQRVVNASTEYIWAKFNNDDNADIAAKYNVTEYPTFIILNPDGQELTRFNGVTGPSLVKHLREGLDIYQTEQDQIETLASDVLPPLIEESPIPAPAPAPTNSPETTIKPLKPNRN